MSQLNYRHLYYFWVVAKEGGFARASERLHMAIQTISTQVRDLERSLGHQLFKPQGRGVVLTEAGEAAFKLAEEIFQIGQRLPVVLREATSGKKIRLAVGLQDSVSKLTAHSVLLPVLQAERTRLLCHEGEFEQLLAELALHHLDVVLAGQPAPDNPNLKLSSQLISASPLVWYGPSNLVGAAELTHFPQCLAELPVLLPTNHAPLRRAIDQWLDELDIQPNVAGEFEDSALLSLFAAKGLGVFPVSRAGEEDIAMMSGLTQLGECGVHDEVYAIFTRRSRSHILVEALLQHQHQQYAPLL